MSELSKAAIFTLPSGRDIKVTPLSLDDLWLVSGFADNEAELVAFNEFCAKLAIEVPMSADAISHSLLGFAARHRIKVAEVVSVGKQYILAQVASGAQP